MKAVLVAVALFAVVGCSQPREAAAPAERETVTETVTEVVTEVVTETAAPEPPAGPAVAIAEPGTYRIGPDLQPGTYQLAEVTGPLGMCYWARLRGVGGTLGDIIANGNVLGPTVVEISASDAAFQTTCGGWARL
jgi:hypothetical protein